MSVINKMLRDLDDRAAAQTDARNVDHVSPLLTRGTSRVSPRRVVATAAPAHVARLRWIVILALTCSVAGGALWIMLDPMPGVRGPAVVAAPESAVSPGARPSLDGMAVAEAAGAVTGVAGPPQPWLAQSRSPNPDSPASTALTAPVPMAKPVAPRGRDSGASARSERPLPVGESLLASGPSPDAARARSGITAASTADVLGETVADKAPQLSRRPAINTSTASSGSSSPPLIAGTATALPAEAKTLPTGRAVASVITNGGLLSVPANPGPPADAWHEGAVDALALAQRQWVSGERVSATTGLRQMLDTHAIGLERPDGRNARMAQALVRELVRMESMSGDQEKVLAALRRYQALVPTQPDLWAVRAQAAQRLADHTEAVKAYEAALRLRANEPRWMLGLAVSLGALGQTQAARHWLAQSHAIVPVDNDVLAFLARLQVRLADRPTLVLEQNSIDSE